tara:strand:- start:1010 stop:1357 length:348 start_codon:yes stop_codon:yes gene_type:complete
MENKKFTDMIDQEVNVGDIIAIPHGGQGLGQSIGLVTELKYLTISGRPRKEPELVWKSVSGSTWDREKRISIPHFLTRLGSANSSKHSTISSYAVNITKLLTPEQLNMLLILKIQ